MDLSTNYLGMKLSSPLVPSASPLSQSIDNIRKMAAAGAGAIVLWSLFEEQIEHDIEEMDYYLEYGAERFAESLTYFPKPHEYHLGPQEYCNHIAKAKKAVDIPIIASLNGISVGNWITWGKEMEQAGADALEVNVYLIPTNPKVTGDEVENVYMTILQAVKSSVSIPVAMKLSPYFSSMANMCTRLEEAGADGLVLFNRFYQPDVDLDALEVRPNLVLSTSAENRLPMRWVAILRDKVQASLAATTGVHSAADAARMIMVGADAVMMCSALLTNGIDYIRKVCQGLSEFMEAKEYVSVEQMKGILSMKHCPEPAAFERANYMKVLQSFRPDPTGKKI
jgi:dihydroorotate dehydrogenase (fumarate)